MLVRVSHQACKSDPQQNRKTKQTSKRTNTQKIHIYHGGAWVGIECIVRPECRPSYKIHSKRPHELHNIIIIAIIIIIIIVVVVTVNMFVF